MLSLIIDQVEGGYIVSRPEKSYVCLTQEQLGRLVERLANEQEKPEIGKDEYDL